MNHKAMILLALLLSIGLMLVAQNAKVSADFSGTIRISGHSIWLDQEAQSSLLLLTPGIVRDSIWVPVAGQEVVVRGHSNPDPFKHIEVQSITAGETTVMIRNDNFEPLHTNPSEYTVVPSTCIGCRLCERNCPVSAITMVGRKAVIDPVKCVECGVCISGNGRFRGCPVAAVKTTGD